MFYFYFVQWYFYRIGVSKSNPDLLENDKPATRQRKFVNIGNIKVSIIQGKIIEEKVNIQSSTFCINNWWFTQPKDMDVNENERLSNITLRHKFK